jgi:hypothetical protein
MNTVKTFLLGFFGTMTLIFGLHLQAEIERSNQLTIDAEALRIDIKHLNSELKSEKMLVELCERELAKYEKPQPPSPSAAVMTWLFGPPTITFESANERKCINVR